GIQVNGLVPGLFPHEDMTGDIQENLARTHDKDACQPAMRVGQRQELGWAATFLASPYARFISGHILVVDGANWQRRSLTNRDIRVTGDTATSRSYFYNPMGRTKRNGTLDLMFVGGFYRDKLRRTADGWRIVERIQDTAWSSSSLGAPGPPGSA